MRMLNVIGFLVLLFLLVAIAIFVFYDLLLLIIDFSWIELVQAIFNVTIMYIVYYAVYTGIKNVIE
jgi:hypothetical protein